MLPLQGQGVQKSQFSETQEAQETQVKEKENLTFLLMQIDQYPPMYMYSCLCCLLRMRDVYRAGVKGHK